MLKQRRLHVWEDGLSRPVRLSLQSAVAAMDPLERAAFLAVVQYGVDAWHRLATLMDDDQVDANLLIEAVSGLELYPLDGHVVELEKLRRAVGAVLDEIGDIFVEEEEVS